MSDALAGPVERWHVGLTCGHQVLLHVAPENGGLGLIGKLRHCPLCETYREIRTCGIVWAEA